MVYIGSSVETVTARSRRIRMNQFMVTLGLIEMLTELENRKKQGNYFYYYIVIVISK